MVTSAVLCSDTSGSSDVKGKKSNRIVFACCYVSRDDDFICSFCSHSSDGYDVRGDETDSDCLSLLLRVIRGGDCGWSLSTQQW